jgi:formate dehydrogenase subunit gamma
MTVSEAALEAILGPFPPAQDSLLPVLHAVQDVFGYVPPHAIPLIARHLNLSRAEVHGVITYYHHFRQTPAKHVVRVCCAEACQANGAEALVAHAKAHGHHPDIHVEPVYCLGLCASGPAVQVDEQRLYARVTPGRFDALIEALEEKR